MEHNITDELIISITPQGDIGIRFRGTNVWLAPAELETLVNRLWAGEITLTPEPDTDA